MNYPFFKPGSYTFFTREAIFQGGDDYPKMLNIEPTNHCNFNCVMCSRRRSGRPLGFMSLDLFDAILADIRRCKKTIRWLTFHNDGEPLLHPDLAEMVRMAKSSGGVEHVHFNTNGQLLTEDKAAALVEAGLDDLTVSIDALTPETFARVKRAGDLETVTANTRRLMAVKRALGRPTPWVRAKIIDMPLTAGELDGFCDFWRPLVDEVQVQPIHNAGGGIGVDAPAGSAERYPCALPWYALAVNWDGTVSPCCVDLSGENIVGDLRVDTLQAVFVDGPIRTYREKMRSGQEASLSPCAGCNVWKNGVNIFEADDQEHRSLHHAA
ncbi:MAG: radical SAM protein [Pseudomonadota bacterium]